MLKTRIVAGIFRIVQIDYAKPKQNDLLDFNIIQSMALVGEGQSLQYNDHPESAVIAEMV